MFDLRGLAPANPAESQISEGGANAADNCIPAAFAYCAMQLGYPDIPPEHWTEDEYGTPAPGPTTLAAAIDEAHHLYPDFPPISAGSPDLGALEAAGVAGHLSVILAWVDCATVTYRPGGGCGRAGVVVAHLAGGWWLWNPWNGQVQLVTESDFAGAIYYQSTIGSKGVGFSAMDPATNAALRKIALVAAAAAAGVSTHDADINPAFVVIASDFSNLGDVVASYIGSHGGYRAAGQLAAGTSIALKVQ